MEETANVQFCHLEGKAVRPLYKYYGNLNYAKDVIRNHRIHLEEPSSYNDLYDGTIMIDEELICRCNNKYLIDAPFMDKYFVGIQEVRDSLRKRKYSIGQKIDSIIEKNTGVVREDLVREVIDNATLGILPPVRGIRVSCFSETKESLPMWAYYANSYSGVCMEFDIKKCSMLQQNCVKVQYSNEFLPNP